MIVEHTSEVMGLQKYTKLLKKSTATEHATSSSRFRAIGADATAARLRPLSALLGLEDRRRPQRMLGERDWGEC